MDEKFRDARQEKSELDEYVSSVTVLYRRYSWLTTIQLQYTSQQQAPRQFTPEAGPSAPPSYAPPSTPPPVPSSIPTIPTNGVNVSTIIENIRGLWECFDRCLMAILNHAPPLLQVLGYLTRWPLNRRTDPYCRY